MNDLIRILEWVRPHGSKSEEDFVKWLHNKIKGLGYKSFFDDHQNLWVVHPTSKVLFTSHTDTVHAAKIKQTSQEVVLDGVTGHFMLGQPDQGLVLGADDGTGIWLMLQMLAAGVEGSFVFFRAEELGCVGSTAALRGSPDLFDGYEVAVAFDRKGTTDVITHQCGSRRCSDEFANAFAAALNDGSGFKFAPSDKGGLTDTSGMGGIIPECTNISVGYYDQHTCLETQDWAFAEALAKKLIQIDWQSLPVVRQPEVEDSWYGDYEDYYGYSAYGVSDELELFALDVAKHGRDVVSELVYIDPEAAIDFLMELCLEVA